jgi:hypothetical protein
MNRTKSVLFRSSQSDRETATIITKQPKSDFEIITIEKQSYSYRHKREKE